MQFDIASAIIPPHRISIGLTHQFSPNFFAGAEIGKSFSQTWGRANDESENYKLFQYRFEVGYILTPEKKYVQHYISTDFVGINHKETLFNGKYVVDKYEYNEKEYSYSKIDYHRTKYAFNFNYGMRIFFGDARKVGIDPKIGLGVNNVNVDFSNAINLAETNGDNPLISMDFPDRYEKEGKERTVNINCQIRFFLCF